jgi:transglutaminase-like putative cysteine protease
MVLTLQLAACSEETHDEYTAAPEIEDTYIDQLDALIAEMTDLQQNSDYGDKKGQYPTESRAILTDAIDDANRAVLLIKYQQPSPSESEKQRYVAEAKASIEQFKSTIRTEDAETTPAELFVDGRGDGGSYIDFGRSEEYVNFGTEGNQAFTVEFWVKVTKGGGKDQNVFLSTYMGGDGIVAEDAKWLLRTGQLTSNMMYTGYIRENDANRIAAAQLVQQFLTSKAFKYSKNPPSTGGKDVVENFLSNSRQGFCVHFASAGTMILRQMGVPCRYVSGYCAKEDSFKSGENDEDICEVKDSQSHAWVEIYLDDFGWIPVEMTPGYFEYVTGENPFDYIGVNGKKTNTGAVQMECKMKPVLWLLLVAALPVQAGTLRCKNALLTEGDTTAELLVRCGQPMLKEDLTRFEENGFGARVTVKYAERWTYNFGKREFMQFVTVENGVITDIADGPRGG